MAYPNRASETSEGARIQTSPAATACDFRSAVPNVSFDDPSERPGRVPGRKKLVFENEYLPKMFTFSEKWWSTRISNWLVRLRSTGALTKLLSCVGENVFGSGLTLSTFWPTGSIRLAGMRQQFPLPSLQLAVAGMRKSPPWSSGLYGFQIGVANIPSRQMACGTELSRTMAAASRRPS